MKEFLFGIAIILLFCVSFWLAPTTHLKNQEIEITIGEKYLFSFDWEEEDPFVVKEIDTVTVLAISGEYVKWGSSAYRPEAYLSCKTKLFKHLTESYEIYSVV